ncbi:hypothetical protein L228DRAFT_267461 [Xylona heveae TC161]|uniref:UDENN domain-containing protein n=1 Tax=Xylona heveae (strain CBS 132557 / TC161) TaxID=1328760 RepID=A0A165HG18_XYLHT|nr:hypothetical protein L228DRAFT_267461 [Xylona heveae TC161]KZF23456.1 hypothetical protein L228DRAFT_267461 [Xylona heveae TC161]
MAGHGSGFDPVVTIVGFHHARGPEIENWWGVADGRDLASENEWSLLPFMALSDGAHATSEGFSYFTLRHEAQGDRPATSLFGISCTRQMDSNELINRPAEVTRSTVQKAVVVIADSPQYFGHLREKLSVVTKAWFAQRDFSDVDIIKEFQASLKQTLHDNDADKDQYLGLSLREMIHEFKYQTLVLFKCCLLQPKMLFFGTRCERLCMMQFSLISLIPGLIRNLQDCADPDLNNLEKSSVKPTSLRTSDRNSLLSYMGLPLQLFGKGSLFGPYTPLQQLDLLADHGTKSYIVGSTNTLLLQQRDRYSDILVNLDEDTIDISSPSLRGVLSLTVADRRWIDFLTQAVNDTWDPANPERPKTMGYAGSEDFIRLQFEEYILALIASVKYRMHAEKHKNEPSQLLPDIEGDPGADFGTEWIEAWMKTDNFRIFQEFTGKLIRFLKYSHLFDIVEPRHPCAGGLTIEDVQRRLAHQVAELHLDERLNTGREALGKHLASGQKKVSSAFNTLWADIEVMREAQRKRQEEHRAAAAAAAASSASQPSSSTHEGGWAGSKFSRAPDFSAAQSSVAAASSRAGAYLSSWTQWASEKRRTGWNKPNVPAIQTSQLPTTPSTQPAQLSSSSVPSSPVGQLHSQTLSKEEKGESSPQSPQHRHDHQQHRFSLSPTKRRSMNVFTSSSATEPVSSPQDNEKTAAPGHETDNGGAKE